MKQKRKKNGAEANGKRSTRLNVDRVDKANGMNLRRVKGQNRGTKCMITLNGGSVDRMDLSESDGEIVNGK